MAPPKFSSPVVEMVRHKHRLQKPQRLLLCILVGLLIINASLLASRLFQHRFRGPEAEGVAVPDSVTEAFLPENRWSRPGYVLPEINGVVIHYVGNPSTSAQANRDYFASLADGRENTFASSHFIVGLEGEVLQCIPLTEIAYASKERNSDTVAIEVCHPDEIGAFSPAAYTSAVDLTAWLCRTFDIDPETEVIRHYDVTGKECPRYYVAHPDAWESFLQDVALQMNTPATPS